MDTSLNKFVLPVFLVLLLQTSFSAAERGRNRNPWRRR
ncbi:hypothetical protein NPIL_122361, partial [Nephila pilipes]